MDQVAAFALLYRRQLYIFSNQLGLPAGLSIYADEKLLALDYVILGSGSRSSKFKINPAELHKVPGLNFVVGLSKDG